MDVFSCSPSPHRILSGRDIHTRIVATQSFPFRSGTHRRPQSHLKRGPDQDKPNLHLNHQDIFFTNQVPTKTVLASVHQTKDVRTAQRTDHQREFLRFLVRSTIGSKRGRYVSETMKFRQGGQAFHDNPRRSEVVMLARPLVCETVEVFHAVYYLPF